VSQFEYVLTANKYNEKSRPVALEVVQWQAALRYSRAAGYASPDTGGMSRDAARAFLQALQTAVQTGRVREEDQGWLDRLLAFLDSDGRGGFGFIRQWRSWRRA
jgi:hypothetical protein